MRKARDVSYRRKFDLKQVEKAQNKRQWILLGVVLSLLACLAVAGTTALVTKHYMLPVSYTHLTLPTNSLV